MNLAIKKIAIIGAGAFGFALAKIIGDKYKNKAIYLFDTRAECARHIKATRQHPVWHRGVKLAASVIMADSISAAAAGADLIILAVPSACLRQAARDLKANLKKPVIILNTAKGLAAERGLTTSAIIKRGLKGVKVKFNLCALSGGMIADEVVKGAPLGATVAGRNKKSTAVAAKILKNKKLRLTVSADLTGVELAGAFKNVVAIGAGLFDGQRLGASSKASFVSRAAAELSALAVAMGAKGETFAAASEAWWGDLLATCFGASRNRAFGEAIGRQGNVNTARGRFGTVEGYGTTKIARRLARRYRVKTPALDLLYKVLYENLSVKEFLLGVTRNP